VILAFIVWVAMVARRYFLQINFSHFLFAVFIFAIFKLISTLTSEND